MPGLLRGVARTAVIAGTASAVNGRVQRRQAEKFADRDASIAAQRQAAYEQQTYEQQPYEQQPYEQQGYPQQPPPVPAQAPSPESAPQTDVVQQLKGLAELRDQGVLTDEEFAAQKARILGG